MKSGSVFAIMLSLLCLVSPVQAAIFDLATVLGNSGFENDLDQWTATSPNDNYDIPEVSPVIYPNDPLEAPSGGGLDFVGVLNDVTNSDLSGKLVHDAVFGSFPIGSSFVVRVCATRGHLLDNPPNPGGDVFSPKIGKPSPEVRVQFFGWTPGAEPVVDGNDNWDRTPTFKSATLPFTVWAASGKWACQTFSSGKTTKALAYVALAIAGINHRDGTFIAFDVVPTP